MEYQEKRALKLERYQELQSKAERQSQEAYNNSTRLSEAIPFGQPILIGHHSEARHRRDIERIRNNMDKSIKLQEKAEYYKNKAEGALNNNSISSDNPEAINLLKEKITKLEKAIIKRKDLNSKLRKFKDRENAIKEVNLLPDTNEDKKDFIKMLEQAKYYAQPPSRINAYYLNVTSNNAEIRRLKERVKALETLKEIPEAEKTINGITIKTDKEDNRVKLFFPSIPSQEIRTELKRNGFKWSPLNKAWQRQLNNYSLYIAEKIVKEVL